MHDRERREDVGGGFEAQDVVTVPQRVEQQRPGGEALHCLIQKALPINDDGEPISFGGYRREEVALNKSSTDHVDGFLRVI